MSNDCPNDGGALSRCNDALTRIEGGGYTLSLGYDCGLVIPDNAPQWVRNLAIDHRQDIIVTMINREHAGRTGRARKS